MSAVKNFFAHQREVKARENAYYARLEEMEKLPVKVDTTAFDKEIEDIDFLLKRNWFLDEDDIHQLLWTASESVFQEVVTRVATYPYNIQQVILSFVPIRIGNVKLKVRDITDDDMEIREIETYNKIKKDLDEAWNAYKNENNLEPPLGYLDSDLDDIFADLQATKKQLEDAKKKSLVGRYVPPGMRDKIVSDDPKVVGLIKKVETLENEIASQKKSIEQERDAWFANKRNEFENQQVFAM